MGPRLCPCRCGCGGLTTGRYVRGHGPIRPIADRFWEKVDKDSGHRVAGMESDCWLWTAAFNGVGYGKLMTHKIGRSSILVDSHRLSWQLANGLIPDSLWVLHRCDNRACIRPDHLFLGTVTDNNVDMAEKGRSAARKKTHCANGHPFDVTRSVNGRRARRCSICERAANRRCYARHHRTTGTATLPPSR